MSSRSPKQRQLFCQCDKCGTFVAIRKRPAYDRGFWCAECRPDMIRATKRAVWHANKQRYRPIRSNTTLTSL